MAVSTRANWKEQAHANSTQPNVETTNDPGSPLTNPPDEDDATPDAPSPPNIPPAEHTSNTPQTESKPIEDSNGNLQTQLLPPAMANDATANDVSSRDLTLSQASYTDFLGELSLSPTSTQTPFAATNNNDQVFIAASLLTPIGSRLTYYSNPHNWSLFRPNSSRPLQIQTELHILQALYLNASYENKRSILLVLEDPKYIAAQVKKMFLTKPDSKIPNYAHVQLQVALLNHFAWSNLPIQSTQIHRLASASNSFDLPEHIRYLFTASQNWQKTLATAAANFLVHKKPEIGSGDQNSPSSDAAIVSLGMRLAVSKNDTLVNHIEQNFISAAIALRGLAEVFSPIFFHFETHLPLLFLTQRLLALEEDIAANRIGPFGDRCFGSGNAVSQCKLYDILSHRYDAPSLTLFSRISLFSLTEPTGKMPCGLRCRPVTTRFSYVLSTLWLRSCQFVSCWTPHCTRSQVQGQVSLGSLHSFPYVYLISTLLLLTCFQVLCRSSFGTRSSTSWRRTWPFPPHTRNGNERSAYLPSP